MASSHLRKLLAGKLIRLAHRINPPTVTECPVPDFNFHVGPLGGDLTSYETITRAQRLESRGWN